MKKLMIAGCALMAVACNPGADSEGFSFDEMTYSPEQTVFKLFAPSSARCFVVVGSDSVAMTPLESTGEREADGTVWTATVEGDLRGQHYVFVVDGQQSPGVFAKAVTVNGQQGVVLDLKETNPEGWADDRPAAVPGATEGYIIYEMHHRDFSVARPDAEHPGKFLALTEPWAIAHLKALGVNAVHILPSYDYGSVDETRLDEPQYNWGYDPVNYNVPEGSYSTNPYDPASRIREFKLMVQALHRAGIGVILDVVYNHTYDIEHSNFQRTFPDYYYRKTADGQYSNGSGCGNETASEQAMMRRFMIESAKYWATEYHIDGFRFDLMGVHDIQTMNAIRQALDKVSPDIFMYGEGWSAGACALPTEVLAVKANTAQMPRIGAFSDDMRDALRGPFSDDTQGAFLAGLPGEEESLKTGLAGMIAHPQLDYAKVNYSSEPYAAEPSQMISYVSCHDDMCLADRLRASIPGITDDELIRLDLLAQTAVFTSQGVPFMLSGEELLRTKQGVHNSFESPDSINQLDWTALERYPQVFDYYKGLTALRRAHRAAFGGMTADEVRQHLDFFLTDDCLVAFRLKYVPGEEWTDIIVVLNANREPRHVAVPEGDYTVVCSDGRIDLDGLLTLHADDVTVAPQSAFIMYRR